YAVMADDFELVFANPMSWKEADDLYLLLRKDYGMVPTVKCFTRLVSNHSPGVSMIGHVAVDLINLDGANFPIVFNTIRDYKSSMLADLDKILADNNIVYRPSLAAFHQFLAVAAPRSH